MVKYDSLINKTLKSMWYKRNKTYNKTFCYKKIIHLEEVTTFTSGHITLHHHGLISFHNMYRRVFHATYQCKGLCTYCRLALIEE